MIIASGFNGSSLESVKTRMMASIETKQARDSIKKKFKLKYKQQSFVMGAGFQLLDEEPTTKHIGIAEVNSIEEFEKFTVGFTKDQHDNPKSFKSNGKYTIFSKIDDLHMYVDIIELISHT